MRAIAQGKIVGPTVNNSRWAMAPKGRSRKRPRGTSSCNLDPMRFLSVTLSPSKGILCLPKGILPKVTLSELALSNSVGVLRRSLSDRGVEGPKGTLSLPRVTLSPSKGTSIIFSLLAPAALSAQMLTYYVVPPTAGCNGIWAVNWFSLECGSAPYTYTMEPMGCLQVNWTYSGDTAFFPLCTLPCAFYITSADGGTCGGAIDPTTAITESNAAPELRITTSA